MFEKRQVAALIARQGELEIDIINLVRQRDNLQDRNSKLLVTNEKLTHTNDMREEKIAHNLKMREETHDLENKKLLEAEKDKCAEQVRTVKDTYRDKLEGELKKRGDEMKTMFTEVLNRLPNISAKLKKI